MTGAGASASGSASGSAPAPAPVPASAAPGMDPLKTDVGETEAAAAWGEAVLALSLFSVDPVGTGVILHGLPGPAREEWLAMLADLMPESAPIRRMPARIPDDRLLGGLDIAATLRAGRPVADRGLLATADRGIVLAAMAERMPASTAARLSAVLDSGMVAAERDGLTLEAPARIGVVALDESIEEDEGTPTALADRCAFRISLDGVGVRDIFSEAPDPEAVDEARRLLPSVTVGDAQIRALVAAATALGVASCRAEALAIRVAKASAALEGRSDVAQEDVVIAARLVLAPRATVMPLPPTDEEPEEPDQPETPEEDRDEADRNKAEKEIEPLEDLVLEAAAATIPPGLLERLRAGLRRPGPSGGDGRAGAEQKSARSGRRIGVRQGRPPPGARIDVVETLRAAVPKQVIRRREGSSEAARRARVRVLPEDFRFAAYKHRSASTVIFVVDASGSSALHRLAEAKGAIELLLADCYVRRDQVALLAFRGGDAEMLLPPTRSMVRAKRSLAALPGGGGTPIAHGIDAARGLADSERRRGNTPNVVLLTDGRANVARDGSHDRAQAREDAASAARRLRLDGVSMLVIDVSPRPDPAARVLSEAADAVYLPMPHADAHAVSRAVQGAIHSGPAR